MSNGTPWPSARVEALRRVYPTDVPMDEVIQRIMEAAPGLPAPTVQGILSRASRMGIKRPRSSKTPVDRLKTDLTGLVVGQLTVLHRTSQKDSSGAYFWSCQCSCGEAREVRGTKLRRGSVTGCVGCTQTRADGIRQQNLVAYRAAARVWSDERLEVLRESVAAGDSRAVTHQKVCAASPELKRPSPGSVSDKITDLGLATTRPQAGAGFASALWPAERLELLPDLWPRPGLSMVEIVSELAKAAPHCPAPKSNTVYLWAKKLGLGARPISLVKNAVVGGGRPFETTIWSPERMAALPGLWAEVLSPEGIRARLADVSPDMPLPTVNGVMDRVRRLKLPPRPRVRAVRPPRPPRPRKVAAPKPPRVVAPKPPKPQKAPLWEPEVIRRVREMRLAGRSFPQIGAVVGRSKDSVAALCRKIEVQPEVAVRRGSKPKPAVTVVVTRAEAAAKAKELLATLFDRFGKDRRKLEARLDEEILEISKKSGMLAATWHRYGRQPEMIPRAGRDAMREVRALIGQVRMERYSREVSE